MYGPGTDYYLKRFPLQTDDDSNSLGVQLDQLTPLVLPPSIDARCGLRAELQVSGQHFQLHAHSNTNTLVEILIKILCT